MLKKLTGFIRKLDAFMFSQRKFFWDSNSIGEYSAKEKHVLKWNELVRIEAKKIHQITYDEIFLFFTDIKRQQLAIGEMSENFDQLLMLLSQKYPKISKDWMALLEDDSVYDRPVCLFRVTGDYLK